jgi:hypothetical protein
MRSMTALMLALAGAGLAAGAASAAEAPKEPDSDPMARICNAFGPGYRLVPGTTTCIKIGGYIEGRITFGNKGGSGDFVPGQDTGSSTPKPR